MDKRTGEIGLVALGGFGEIGMNCLALEASGSILVVDCGIMFPSPEEPGIDVIHPSFEYLVANRERIVGVVLTHGHEDHISAVPYLLREVDVPVFAGPYALALVERKHREVEGSGKLVGRPFPPGGTVSVGPFTIRSAPLPHSIAESCALVIEACGSRILHTGDFKLGIQGEDGGRPALDTLAEIGRGGVDLMICDSTGAEEDDVAGDEGKVAARIEELLVGARGTVFAAIFSSNRDRLSALFRAARVTGRKIALTGRSVIAHAEVAAAAGLLSIPRDLLVPLEDVEEIPRSELLVIAAGTQGESRSALGRIASGDHRQLRVAPGDLVVLSSRFIPGNELAISRMMDRLLRAGADVVHRGIDPDVHVSGHGTRTEIEAAVRAVNPKAFLAAHGTFRHLKASAAIAARAGVSRVLSVSNGDLVRLTGARIDVLPGFAPTGRVMIDGANGVPESAMRERRLLGAHGLVHVVWCADAAGEVVGEIDVTVRGVLAEEALPWFRDEVRGKLRAAIHAMDAQTRSSQTGCRDGIRAVLRRFCERTLSREPYVIATILPATRSE